MKKTLITSTLIAALAAPAVMAQDTTEQTSDYTIDVTSSGNDRGNYYGWTMTLTDGFLNATATETDAPELATLDSVRLDSIKINYRDTNGGGDPTTPVYLAIYEYAETGTGTFVGVSKEQTNFTYNGSITFTFTDVTLDTNKQYQYLFVTSNTLSDIDTFTEYKTHAGQLGIKLDSFDKTLLPSGEGLYKNSELTSMQGANNAGENYMPDISVGVSVTPEPTTATLSLLALAGLCARRRRK